jgi:hypothetical protein
MLRILVTVLAGLAGGFLGLMIPWWLAQRYVAQGGDPMDVAVYSFFPIVTVPFGITVGATIALIWINRTWD